MRRGQKYRTDGVEIILCVESEDDAAYIVWQRVVVDRAPFYECRALYRGLSASAREELFMSLVVNTAIDDEGAADKRKRPGTRSYKLDRYESYPRAYALARRYFRMRCRHIPGYFAGRAASEVRKHCLKNQARYSAVPSQPSIKACLREKTAPEGEILRRMFSPK